ncbi:hypothetical protein GWI33_013873 [Rhynchophorus ferrugineus]|uniref:Uncharacterized protein n=1 Tax=Rhynchophorus ferrugineus TaxID=354439 RepID=A0A834MB63_RHYFE|nr:hypothetical protein GWI33_013873 [Rhynchophorus ferrugineus]
MAGVPFHPMKCEQATSQLPPRAPRGLPVGRLLRHRPISSVCVAVNLAQKERKRAPYIPQPPRRLRGRGNRREHVGSSLMKTLLRRYAMKGCLVKQISRESEQTKRLMKNI